MLRTYPSAWLLLTLPFLSSVVIRSVPCLWGWATTLNWLTRPLGTVGLVCLFGGMFGLIPSPYGLPVAIAGGLVSGYTVFSLRGKGNGSDGGDWRRGAPPPDEPPPPPVVGGPIDWQLFDRLRTRWEREPVSRC